MAERAQREDAIEPESRFYESQRLKLHYAVWGDEPKPPLLMIHGGRDHARNWDRVAEALVDSFCIYAPDLRGHGDSAWAMGGQYSMPEFVLDIAALADAVGREPLSIIGHSLGGAIALQFTGVYPERVRKVVSIEGLGPPMGEPRLAHVRMQQWMADMRDLEQRRLRRYPTIDAAVERMQEENPHLTPEMARHLTVHGTKQVEDGLYTWKFDNFARAHSPYEFNLTDAREIWNQIRCPVLLVRGSESWATDPEEDGRASSFHDYRSITIEDAGHWVHHDQCERFIEV
ncbi:MAG: alpha/beta hydrolase, partial [Dehalococcoidia bacterium]|nr:alpha/beta hydrolase [Dehalococcoidia bacterium]